MRTLLAAALLLTACGEGAPRVTAGTSPTPSPSPLMLHCRGGLPFPVSALDRPADAEKGTDDAAVSLRTWLDSATNEQSAPRTGWRELARTGTEVLYAQGTPLGTTVRFERTGGRWLWAGSSSDCNPHVLPPKGLSNATWSPTKPVAPATATFTALVEEIGCAGGQPPTGRVKEPVVSYTEKTVVVTFFVVPLGGTRTCPGAPPEPYEVTLREPLGDRTLLDGSAYPPSTPRPGI